MDVFTTLSLINANFYKNNLSIPMPDQISDQIYKRRRQEIHIDAIHRQFNLDLDTLNKQLADLDMINDKLALIKNIYESKKVDYKKNLERVAQKYQTDTSYLEIIKKRHCVNNLDEERYKATPVQIPKQKKVYFADEHLDKNDSKYPKYGIFNNQPVNPKKFFGQCNKYYDEYYDEYVHHDKYIDPLNNDLPISENENSLKQKRFIPFQVEKNIKKNDIFPEFNSSLTPSEELLEEVFEYNSIESQSDDTQSNDSKN